MMDAKHYQENVAQHTLHVESNTFSKFNGGFL